jgi:tyrosyl-tRNA synthetase
MGKTEKGAVWLDPRRTSPYDYYQYWINTDDRDVGKFLALFTFLPMDEVRRLSSLEGADIREAKEVLARECTAILHGGEAAAEAREASRALFSEGGAPAGDAVPTVDLELAKLEEGVAAFVLFSDAGLVKSRGEARRLIQQGGAYVNSRRIDQFDEKIGTDDIEDGFILLRAGKKKYMRLHPV